MTSLMQLARQAFIVACIGSLDVAGLRCLGPAVQYLAGEMPVEAGAVIPLQASHNTVAMRFDIKEADYIHLARPDASFPRQQFSSMRDSVKLQVMTLLDPQKLGALLCRPSHYLHEVFLSGANPTSSLRAGPKKGLKVDLGLSIREYSYIRINVNPFLSLDPAYLNDAPRSVKVQAIQQIPFGKCQCIVRS